MQKLSIIVIAVACAAVIPAEARAGQASQSYALGFTAIYCDCSNGACPAFCLSPNASRVITPLSATAGPNDSSATWSPDGAKIAYLSGYDVVVMDAAGSNPVNVTFSASVEVGPAWSPDGARIAFASDRSGAPELYLMNPDGSNVVRVTTQVGFVWSRATWSPDSRRLAFACEVAPGNRDICVIDANGSGLVRLTADPAIDDGAAWSPDGATIAFTTTRYGADPQLATMRSDGSNVTRLGGGIIAWDPAWSPDGLYLAFTSWGSESFGVFTMTSGGDDITWIGDFLVEPAWMPGDPPIAPPGEDATPPHVSCGAADSTWHGSDVTIVCAASDLGSGLANAANANFNLTTHVPVGTETANALTDSLRVCDSAGNCTIAGPFSGNKVDKKAPTVSCGAANDAWHNSNAVIACTADDLGSRLTSAASPSFLLTTAVAAGTETASANTDSRQVCDTAGNCRTAGPIGGNKVDRKAPAITIASPAAGTAYGVSTKVAASYACSDEGAGMTACAGPVANGSLFSTSPLGTRTFAVKATDRVGNSSTLTVTYTVVSRK